MALPGINYVYDPLGRLVAVTDPAGDTATQEYDDVGNLVSIRRRSSAELSVISFMPRTGSAGRSVVVYGTGFSPSPGGNSVTFNGVPASVISATATQIVTAVPPGAATGPISVTTPTASAATNVAFTVVPAPEAPVISGFSPTIGTVGTQVAISGTNFGLVPASNRVTFNRTLAFVESANATVVETVVPPGMGSGPIALTTPAGRSISNGDFFIPPAPRTATDVEFTGRVALGDSAAVTIGTPNMIALVVCDALAGHSLNIGTSEVTFANQIGTFELSVLSPHEAILARKIMAGLAGQPGEDMAVNSLPETGTYTVVIDPGATPVSLTLTLSEPVTGVLTVDGPPVLVSLEKPGQRGQLTFDGSIGQRVSLGVGDVSSGAIEVAILNPDGTLLASKITASDTVIHPDPLPETGNYAITIDPDLTETVSMTLTLSGQQ